jgi:hypothetical protein
MSQDPLHDRLRRLLGHRFDYIGEVWVLIEVLGDVDSIVLQRCEHCRAQHVQQNLYGVPNRRVDDTLTLKISDHMDSGGYSDDVLLLLEGHHKSQ